MSTVLASGADRRYGLWLLNLIGSVHANSRETFDAIVVYDLGLSGFQRRLAAGIRGVELRTVPELEPHRREGFAWKAWILRHLEADRLVWLDAGATVLRPLDDAVAQIDERGYWVVSQGHPLRDIVPSDYYARYGIPESYGDRTVVAAGIIGFARPSRFFDQVIVPTYEDCAKGLSRGFSSAEVDRLNYGLNYSPDPVIRDCAAFRWDQTILNLRLYAADDDPVVNDVDRWAGTAPDAHPEQVIWAHRRRGDFRDLARVPYRALPGLLGRPFGLAFRIRWWIRSHRWLFRSALYRRKAQQLAGWARRARR